MKNKWKIAFIVVSSLFLLIISYCVYDIVDKSVTISYLKEGYEDTESDLRILSDAVNSNDKSFDHIKKIVAREHKFSGDDTNTIELNTIDILFKNDSLYSVVIKG